MLTPERLRAIKERCERATEGPWGVRHRCRGCGPDDDEAAGLGLELVGPPQPLNKGQFARSADAQFCAHAREDVPALVAEVERLQELKDDYRLRIEHMATALGLIQSEAEALKQAIEAAKSAGGAERLDEIAKHVQAILDVLGRV